MANVNPGINFPNREMLDYHMDHLEGQEKRAWGKVVDRLDKAVDMAMDNDVLSEEVAKYHKKMSGKQSNSSFPYGARSPVKGHSSMMVEVVVPEFLKAEDRRTGDFAPGHEEVADAHDILRLDMTTTQIRELSRAMKTIIAREQKIKEDLEEAVAKLRAVQDWKIDATKKDRWSRKDKAFKRTKRSAKHRIYPVTRRFADQFNKNRG